MKYVLILSFLALAGCASLGTVLQSAGNGLSNAQKNNVTCQKNLIGNSYECR